MKKNIVLLLCFLCVIPVLPAFKWVINFPSSGGTIQSIAAGPDGTIYATGGFNGTMTVGDVTYTAKSTRMNDHDFFLFAFAPDRSVKWIKTGGGKGPDCGSYVAQGGDSVFVAGQFSGTMELDGGGSVSSAGKGSMFIARYSLEGERTWIKTTVNDGYITLDGFIADTGGNLYAMGGFDGEYIKFGTVSLKKKKGLNWFIVKYTGAGEVMNVIHVNGGDIMFITKVQGRAIAVNKEGAIYFTGSIIEEADFGGLTHKTTVTKHHDGPDFNDEEMFLVKYSPGGKPLWYKKIGSGGEPIDMKFDSAGNIVIAGYIDGVGYPGPSNYPKTFADVGGKRFTLARKDDSLIPKDIFIAKFDPSGNCLWAVSYGDIGGDEPRSLAIDKDDSIIIGGFFSDRMSIGKTSIAGWSPGKNDALVAKFDKNGKPLWAFGGGGKKWDHVNSVAVSPNGTVYAGGYFEDTVMFGKTELKSRSYNSFFLSAVK
ncbi:MAG: hypothetical protein KA369_01290 [Spirochaetes bacterium]|nr:hypothetical protein [Spirochaetota bacterium]